MSLSARDIANRQQRRASNPAVSAFVSASAGSGKTKLLTDRLLRLMLAGAAPARIQCLTFTKAAAAEMALRLQRRLGKWVTLDDTRLDADLASLDVDPTEQARETARALFANVLDLPGGMRIGTIHAFCQSLLRRFPLEAQLSPHFDLADDRDTMVAWQAARETMLAHADTQDRKAALERLAGLVGLAEFGKLVETLQRDRGRLEDVAQRTDVLEALHRILGATEPGALGTNVSWSGEADLRRVFMDVAAGAPPSNRKKAEEILAWLALPVEDREANWSEWRTLFITDGGADRKLGVFVHHKSVERFPDAEPAVLAEQARIGRIEDGWRAHEVAELSAALLSLAVPVTAAYAASKTATARLDYEDLIGHTASLLVNPGAAWVLYKLDGGLDHVLLDEVQDTAPAQWQIAGSLTEEFFTGSGARSDVTRTVFAVGDRKQSIYGFQGADPDAFEHWRTVLRDRVQTGGQDWEDVSLDVSFRSTTPVLALVDAVFAQPDAAKGVTDGAPLRHIADRADHAGRCELWPLVPKPEPMAVTPWDIPTENLRQTSAMQRLADSLAEWIAGQVTSGGMLESKGRPVAAGDFLVLVRRRNAFPAALMRALKSRGVKVAGLDRMVLTAQPAIADLMALCDTLLLPQDDLALACVLTSPLGGMTEDQLMELAPGRSGPLWDVLRQSHAPACQDAASFIAALLSRVDHASPHALLSEALGPLGGRARLLARLGPEAAEPIDELLSAALRHAQTHPPSLQGFLHWLRQSAAEVKREPEGPGGEGFDSVRIMTVHGAKGLQAPIVILPDTTGLPPDDERVVWAPDPASDEPRFLPVWSPGKDQSCTVARGLRDAISERQAAEQNRLLYVALTRAEDRLLICGWQTGKEVKPNCWYAHVASGFEALGATAAPFDAIATPWEGDTRVIASPQTAKPDLARETRSEAATVLPAWAGAAPDWRPHKPPPEPALPTPLAPSRPDGVTLGEVPQAASPLLERDTTGARFRRGRLIHTLLQHLPDLPPQERAPAARRHLAHPGLGIADPDATVGEVMAVLEHPQLSALFGPGSRAEIPLSGVVGGQVIGGLIDRLAVGPDRIILADYKTNRAAPRRSEDVPVLYLRQMAAYRSVLAAIHPGRPIECWLIWTADARVMPLPHSLLDGHAPGAAPPS
jgi:ATP-dependent helicase/nuclease subunit A